MRGWERRRGGLVKQCCCAGRLELAAGSWGGGRLFRAWGMHASKYVAAFVVFGVRLRQRWALDACITECAFTHACTACRRVMQNARQEYAFVNGMRHRWLTRTVNDATRLLMPIHAGGSQHPRAAPLSLLGLCLGSLQHTDYGVTVMLT